MKLSKKLYFAFGTLVLLMTLSSIFVWFKVSTETARALEIKNDDLPGMIYYNKLLDISHRLEASALEYANGDLSKKRQFNELLEDFKETHETLYFYESAKASDRQKMAEIIRLMSQYHKQIDATIFSSNGNAQSSTRAIQLADTNYLQPLKKILTVSATEERDDATQSLDQLVNGLNSTLLIIITICIIAAILGLVIAYSLNKSIITRLNQVLEIAERVSNGDISQPDIIHQNQDEIDSLATSTNKMAASLNHLLKEISKVVGEVRTSSHCIAETNNQIAVRSQTSSDQSTQVATAIEEMSATVSEVAAQSQIAAGHAEQARYLASQGGKSVGETIDKIRAASKDVQNTADNVTSLGELSSQIGNVIGVIGSIAEQTNLLALNAAIEAARAGEQGRGFAVVADEVRTLAERTSQATEEVVSTVQSIQQQTDHAVNSMQSSVSQVEQSVVMAEVAGSQLGEIVKSASEIASMIQSIATATEEQSVVASEMARDVSHIEESSRNSLQDTQVAARSGEALSTQATTLAQLVQKFNLRT
ncbi:methyl-accepting chemotaxis protein [Pseudoalteromonas peptidolytica]|uniref:Methyl-accepting chemotaxis protein n=1 Tax=Pseudoalteromonas peptidolytica F12-50-A1 TaxID=1315280 RepID=A0A8I0N230_9GAMM|nr:HAMP domain-containing methyl-accepting chemotaxis protein [Pseudoalteromonas peptidolytica]MBE0349139.1 methyl-accepting chemotaxis protein [Pseudoalteromonas peptidolytica F12-50-A1]NLR16250.1 methyl-accepting chemotaxis protein [Pseudoalteromonas peptidolytica]GEK10710.1 methyl-accepting chemotaxis protein [Pseudoalteromonas peptidolytica]